VSKRKREKPSRDYSVGYKKPPESSRFKPGQSGNPKGRPKEVKNLKTDLEEELSQRINVREGERSKTVSKQRALVKSALSKALKGDVRAQGLLLRLIVQHFPEMPLDQDFETISKNDEKIVSDFINTLEKQE